MTAALFENYDEPLPQDLSLAKVTMPTDAPVDLEESRRQLAGLPEPETEDLESAELIIDMSKDELSPERLKGVSLTNDLVKDYLRAIGKTPLLNALQEVELAKAIEAGLLAKERLATGDLSGLKAESAGKDQQLIEELQTLAMAGDEARQQFIQSNLRLSVAIAKRYWKPGGRLDFEELIQIGNVGLMHAIEKFDYAKGYKFSTYATWWIRQNITRQLADIGRTIRLPVHLDEKLKKLNWLIADMEKQQGRQPSVEELSKALALSAAKVEDLLQINSKINTVSLDKTLDESGLTVGDIIVDDSAPEAHDIVLSGLASEALDAALSKLDTREAKVIRMRFGLTAAGAMTLDDIGTELGVSRERVRQIQGIALAKLRHPSVKSVLRDYLPD